MKHTPLPWFSRKVSSQNIFIYPDKDCIGESIAGVGCIKNTRDRREGPANAAFIVRACNSHYELVEALQKVHSWLVCAAITTPEDMAQSFPDMEAIVAAALSKATPNTEEAKGER